MGLRYLFSIISQKTRCSPKDMLMSDTGHTGEILATFRWCKIADA
jgi:hypothetical protein